MTPADRVVLADSHRRLRIAVGIVGERRGLGDRARCVLAHLCQPHLERDPAAVLAAHAEVLALLTEAIAADAVRPGDCGKPARAGARPWWA